MGMTMGWRLGSLGSPHDWAPCFDLRDHGDVVVDGIAISGGAGIRGYGAMDPKKIQMINLGNYMI